MTQSEFLPWERSSGDPTGTGICLSGGGLRAASFAMGVLQELQQQEGLVFGPKAADHLAVVSGGSYIAASMMLNAGVADAQTPPIADASPEAVHIVAHGRYLVDRGWLSIWPFFWRFVVSAAAAVLLFSWSGFIIADLGAFIDQQWPQLVVDGWSAWLVAAGAIAAITMVGVSQQTDRVKYQYVYSLVGLPAFAVSAPTLLAQLRDTVWLRSPWWWLTHWVALLALAVYIIASAIPLALAPTRRVADAIVRLLLRSSVVLVTCWVIAAFAPRIRDVIDGKTPTTSAGIALVAPIFGGMWASRVHNVASLHRPYRDLAARCFAVTRSGSTVAYVTPPTAATLSGLVPPADDVHRHPRLLVCATANIRHRTSRDAVPFVFSHDRSGLAGTKDASFSTAKLEVGKARTRTLIPGTEPELSLMSAVAMTGAAVSPMMGTKTNEGARPILAALNLRLGVWLPNPLSPNRRRVVEMRPARLSLFSRQRSEWGLLGPGFSAVLGEVLGAHSPNARRIYVTDGGHYDNLGLITLLRARCETIWCVDAYAGRKHLGRQLSTGIALAAKELDVTIDIDVTRFDLVGGSLVLAGHSFAVGTVTYPDSAVVGKIIVLKSALTASTPQPLRDYRTGDAKFPYHATFIQWYGHDRFEHYRLLGRQVTSDAIASGISGTSACV